ncbi:MAG TPA: hypothetical protein VMH39_16360 [Gemmatimonadaceae bacterium]|nr:hypothetical protein [Gemmatimonadaceae bacterium]
MTNMASVTRQVAAVVVGAVVLGVIPTPPAGSAAWAQAPAAGKQTVPDQRWDAWTGCWIPEPASGPVIFGGPESESAPRVCIRHDTTPSAVDIVTTVRGQVAGTQRVVADGARHTVAANGCTGWETAEWSPGGARVYIRSDLTCQGAPERISSGIIAMTASGEWLDVRGTKAGTNSGVGVVRYWRVDDSASTVAQRIAASMSVRAAAERWVSTMDVADAARHVDAPVVEAWLLQLNQNFAVDASGLAALARAGANPELTDLVVALAYPSKFVVDRATFQTTTGPSAESPGAQASGFDDYGYYDPYFYSYGFSPYGIEPFGYGVYGRYYAGGYGGGSTPIVVVNSAPTTPPGHVVNGRGYTQASSGTAGSTGTAQPSASSAPAASNGSSNSGGSSSPPPSAPPPAPARTAIPRPPSGGGL